MNRVVSNTLQFAVTPYPSQSLERTSNTEVSQFGVTQPITITKTGINTLDWTRPLTFTAWEHGNETMNDEVSLQSEFNYERATSSARFISVKCL